MTPVAPTFFFYLLATIAIASAVAVITRKNPVHSALALIFTLLALAGLYLMLYAPFVAAVQIVLYAGGIMVLFLFVIMYLNLKSDVETGVQIALRRAFGWLVGAILAAEAIVMFAGKWAMGPETPPAAEALVTPNNTLEIGKLLYTRYLFPFEITSLILLAAMVGVIVMGKEHLMIGRRDGRTEVE